MKIIISISVLLLSLNLFAQADVPHTPPNACYQDCNEKQHELLNEFETVGVLPDQAPAVYSGVCNHNGMYSPDVDHYTVVLLDQRSGNWNYSAIFGYFLPEDEWRDWSVETARAEMSPYWGEYGNMTVGDNTAKAVVRDNEGKWAYIYWMRQNPITKDLLLISYAGFVQRSFCRLQKHPAK